jgi:hypothetical protein
MAREQAFIQAGNIEVDTADMRGWLIGNFIGEEHGLRHSEDVELKWGNHEAGTVRAEWVTGETRTSIGILIAGKFAVEFRDKEIVFDKPGDYVMWGPGTDHRWRAIENSIWLTVRWPSVVGFNEPMR